jgi:hypothetical protein
VLKLVIFIAARNLFLQKELFHQFYIIQMEANPRLAMLEKRLANAQDEQEKKQLQSRIEMIKSRESRPITDDNPPTTSARPVTTARARAQADSQAGPFFQARRPALLNGRLSMLRQRLSKTQSEEQKADIQARIDRLEQVARDNSN